MQIIPTESVTESQATLVHDDLHNFAPNIIVGNIISNIGIVNAQFPENDGEYTCIGTNDNQLMNSSSAVITVQVVGK